YDLRNRPSYRFIERLLYASPFYDPSFQSIALSAVDKDERPFVYSTPRLPNDAQLHLSLPFNHDGIDELFRMRDNPQPLGYMKETLGLEREDEELFLTFLTREPPVSYSEYQGAEVRIRYFGHACVLMEYK